MPTEKNSFSGALGIFLLALLFFMQLVSGVALLLHIRVNMAIFPISMVLAGGLAYLLSARGKVLLYSILSAILLIVCSCAICSLIYDSTYDSYSYHYNSVVMMAKGWNPVYEAPWNGSIWNQHYAKGLEVMQAVVLTFTGDLQSTKCVNLMLVFASASLVWFTLGEIFPRISRLWKMAIVFMVIANPIVICQMTTAYNDYMLWPETVLLTCSFLLTWKNPRMVMPYLLLMMTFVIGINSKFTHFYYLGIGCLFFASWCLCAKRYNMILPDVVTVLCALVIGIFTIGFNPYVLNTVGYGNPLYPLLGSDIDIMTYNTPEMYQDSNRFLNFLMSLLSIGDTPWSFFTGGFTLSECLHTYTMDSRTNGFGIFMAPILASGVILMVCNKASWRWWVIYVFFLSIGFSFEQSWWARYVPFLWALVIIPVLNYAVDNRHARKSCQRTKRILALLILSLVFVNASLAAAVSLMSRYSFTAYINCIIESQKKSRKPIKVTNMNYTFHQIFKENGVDYEECELKQIADNSDNLFTIYALYKADVVALLPEEDFPELYLEPTTLMEKLIDFPKRKYDPTISNDNTQ